jgi:hypothetical protein
MLACEREPRRFDLGVVGVPERGGDALGHMDDMQLESEHARVVELIEREGLQHAWEHSAYLLEMARRGGERWMSFLRRELELVRDSGGAEDSHFGAESELAVLTALRRAEGRPDPARIVLRSATPRTLREGEGLELEFALLNNDPDAAFAVSTWLFQRVRLEVRDATGALVPRKHQPNVTAGGAAEGWPLEPGVSTAESPGAGWWSVELGEPFALPAGEYSLELVYAADRERIAFADDTSGLVVVRSSPIFLAVTAAK